EVRMERRKCRRQDLHYTISGGPHQDHAADADLDGATVDLPHLRRAENFHKWRTRTMVISSCSSDEPVHCSTDSLVRAKISLLSSAVYLTTRSVRRPSPNCSPYSFSGSTTPSV